MRRLVIFLTVLISLPTLYFLFIMQKLPWQKPKFDTVPIALAVTGKDRSVLIFSKTNGFRHKSIETGIEAITKAGEMRGWNIQATENGMAFNLEYLQNFRVIVFLSTTGDILTQNQKKAFEQYIENGGGYAGIHSASDTEHNWRWYDKLLGTHFKSHTLFPKHIVDAEIITETFDNPSTKHLAERWHKEDEWYNLKNNVRGVDSIRILLSLNDASYSSLFPKRKGTDHPVSWSNIRGKGRMFYTAMGHTSQTFTDSNALQHILGGIDWAGKF